MPTTTASVGKGGVNRPDDVKVVQTLLNQNITRLAPLLPVPVSGTCDAQTILTIEEFQRRVMHVTEPDGRVDPGGRTISELGGGTSASGAEPTLDGSPLPPAAAKVLKEILRAAGLSRATVTSVTRTPADQARVMYDNCVAKGVAFNKQLYA